MTDHNTRARQEWIKSLPDTANWRGIRLELRERWLSGILVGVVLMLAYVVLLGQFPAVCG